jgi:hypothetical protein
MRVGAHEVFVIVVGPLGNYERQDSPWQIPDLRRQRHHNSPQFPVRAESLCHQAIFMNNAQACSGDVDSLPILHQQGGWTERIRHP